MSNNPSYYAIIPASIRYSNKINSRQKLLYSEITALSNKDGYCSASNSYWAKLYNVSSLTISRDVSALEEATFIKCIYLKDNTRRIYLSTDRLIPPIDQALNTPIDQALNHNNTSINNIDIQEAKQLIVRYFQNKVDGAYPVLPDAALYDNLKTIIEKGYTIKQIKKLIDHKATQFHRREIDAKVFRLSWMFKPVNFFEQYSIMERPAQKKSLKSTASSKRVETDSNKWNNVTSL